MHSENFQTYFHEVFISKLIDPEKYFFVCQISISHFLCYMNNLPRIFDDYIWDHKLHYKLIWFPLTKFKGDILNPQSELFTLNKFPRLKSYHLPFDSLLITQWRGA